MSAPAPLPPLVVLTDGSATGSRPLAAVVAAAVAGGARAVVLREKHLPRAERRDLALAVAAVLAPVGGVLLVASDAALGADPAVGAAGVHLAASDPLPPGADGQLVGRSCHSPADVAAAGAEGCAYATLSPIHPSPSKPGYGPALGTGALAGLPLPVWALGGVDATNATACVAAGAAGVAVMGAVMRAPDPAATVEVLCRALAGAGAAGSRQPAQRPARRPGE